MDPEEERLAKELRLCRLTTHSDPGSDNNQAPMEMVIGEQKLREHTPERGLPTVLEPNPENGTAMSSFAHTMAVDIVQSAMCQWERASPSSCPPGQDRLAEKLVSAVIQAALRETAGCGECQRSSSISSSPSSDMMAHGHGEAGMDIEIANNGETPLSNVAIRNHWSGSSTHHPSRDLPSTCPLLPQSGLPNVGSLDYPDAPPTTPLLPEMVKSRASFSRKLKGGLAKEFLPLPPPPTPKDKQTDVLLESEAVEDPQAEFVGHLLRSLSLECSEREEELWRMEDSPSGTVMDSYDEVSHEGPGGPHRRAKMMVYAESLSDDIITWITTMYPVLVREQRSVEELHLIADQLSYQIIMSSMDEVIVTCERNKQTWTGRLKNPQGKPSQKPRTSSSGYFDGKIPLYVEVKPEGEDISHTLSPTLQPNANQEEHHQPSSGLELERLTVYVGRLILDALSQAGVELQGVSGQDSLLPLHDQRWRGDPCPKDSTSTQLSNPNQSSQSDPTINLVHSSASISTIVNHFYAEDLAQAVVMCSLAEAKAAV